MWRDDETPRYEQKDVSAALGQGFDAKVRLARTTGMIASEVAESIQYLHGFRNTVYHQGKRHEGILHSLGIFYFRNACSVLEGFQPLWWSTGSRDKISHRAIKYLGKPSLFNPQDVIPQVCSRLLEVAKSLGDTLVKDLHADMQHTITQVDEQIDFLSSESPRQVSRTRAIVDAQAWPFAFSEEGKAWAREHGCPTLSVGQYVDWLSANYSWPVRADPIRSWTKRADTLAREKNHHAALKRYSDFMRQTEGFREQIDEAAAQLDAHIQHQIDVARGK